MLKKLNIINALLVVFLLYIIYSMIKSDQKTRVLLLDKIADIRLTREWLERRNEGISIYDYFERNGYKSIIIYGAGTYGKTLAKELEGTDVNIKFFVNSTHEYYNVGKPVHLLENLTKNDIDDDDVFVVTPIEHYGKIAESLREITDNTIVSLEEVVNLC